MPMPLQAVLLDLDDTLLGNRMDAFLPAYFKLIAQHAAGLPGAAEVDFLPALLAATRAVIANTVPTLTNEALFWQVMQERSGVDWDALGARPYFDSFYATTFHQLRGLTEPRPLAAKLVRWIQAQGLRVVIATNPLYPSRAIDARLAWAGLPPAEFQFDLVTHYGNMHATKPHPAYYQEILERLNCEPAAALMVGDSWDNDIAPAAALGLASYWVNEAVEASQLEVGITSAHGSLAQLWDRLQAGWLM